MKYSIVVPVYRSESFVEKTVAEIMRAIAHFRIDAEIILVNDGSPDNSWGVIKRLAAENRNIKSINFVKNYGQHNAVLCGFAHSTGDYVITLDDDLQNPPMEIGHLIEKANSGDFDLVFGRFREKKHSLFRRFGSKLIGFLNQKVFNKPSDIVLTNFRIIRRDLIERVLSHKTPYPYVPGLLLMYSTRMANVLVDHQERADGVSNYTLKKIISLMSRLLINYSSYPLRLLSTIGLFVSLVSFVVGLFYLAHGLFLGVSVPGWTTLVVLVSFLGGFIIALLGLVGEYLSRILDQLSTPQSYFIKEIHEKRE
ncbi:glycosyltransferase family 2 protein [Pseudomonas sp. JS3066]|uniref:glycosyltransferase family 2 protein n=1 Tax=Pseudomonas sp. JS3066 TaxID=3090665 RepID=UPI002E7C1260|nr:glycosyltransferase family 2 protein [Pseudomonas sp. JS3066]WVK92837.1 glycosyltransferase family 2 protein [Pseudomonas sp. JS3066]